MKALEVFAEYMKSPAEKDWLYHFTDARNLDSIREHGLLSKRVMNALDVIYCASGSNQSLKSDAASGVEDYVSLSLTDDHPMKRAVSRKARISKIVTLKVNPAILAFDQIIFCKTMANRKDAEFFHLDDAVAQGFIDFGVLYAEDECLRRSLCESQKKCELLIPNSVPPSFISF